MTNEIWIVIALNQALLDGWLGNGGASKANMNSTKPGFYFKEQNAIEAVLANANDLCEGQMNKYAVIYPIEEGIDMPCLDKNRYRWFEYVLETDTFKEIGRIDIGCIVLGIEREPSLFQWGDESEPFYPNR